jgi:hypothetical protein
MSAEVLETWINETL